MFSEEILYLELYVPNITVKSKRHKISNKFKFQTAARNVLQERGHRKDMKNLFLTESGEISDKNGISIYSTPLCIAVAVGPSH